MTRWGKPTKNVRRGNPKYRLDESNTPAEPNMEALGKAESALKAGDWLNHMGMPTSGDGDWSHEINPDNGRIKLYFNGGFLGTILPDGEYTSYVDSAAGSEPIHKSLHPLVKALKAEPSLKRKATEDPHAISSWGELRERKSMQNLFEGFNRFLNESFAMGADSRHPNPGRPNTDQLNVAELGAQQWLEAVLNEPFTSTSMGSGGGVGTDNTTTLAQMFQDGHISDINDMQRHLEEIMYEDGMPDEEIQAILTHLSDAMYENGLV